MKTEQELLSMLRSALDEHEKTPFDEIRSAVASAQNAKKTSKRAGFWRQNGRSFALAAACLVIMAGVGFAFQAQLRDAISSGYTANAPMPEETCEIAAAEPGVYESPINDAAPAPEAANDFALRDSAAGLAPPGEAANDLQAAPALSVSDDLLALLNEYADRPSHRFSVQVAVPVAGGAEGVEDGSDEGRNSGSGGESFGASKKAIFSVQELTAEEIWKLADQGYFLDIAPDDSSSAR